jgi:hypothetical protein
MHTCMCIYIMFGLSVYELTSVYYHIMHVYAIMHM